MDKFLTIRLNEEFFALKLKEIREVLPYSSPSPVPNMPAYISGLIHLRGFFLPVIDMKKILFLPEENKKRKKKIVVVSFLKRVVGISIDDAEDIITVEDNQIIPPPNLISNINSNYFSGGFYLYDKVILILDLKKIFTDINLIKELTKERAS
ncbi:MAG: chemotaxis protein CheW [Proteobacteria bacterium]|nr:chemotaxis protein CheW [Pseudomonadota bacterium]